MDDWQIQDQHLDEDLFFLNTAYWSGICLTYIKQCQNHVQFFLPEQSLLFWYVMGYPIIYHKFTEWVDKQVVQVTFLFVLSNVDG